MQKSDSPFNQPSSIFHKKPNPSNRTNSPSATRYSPHTSPLPHKFPKPGDLHSQPSPAKRKNSVFAQEKEELLKHYYKCLEIRNSSREAMILIKEKTLEIREKVLNKKIKSVQNHICSCSFEVDIEIDDSEVEEEIKQPIKIHRSPEKLSMNALSMKHESAKESNMKKDLMDSVFGLGKSRKSMKGKDIIPAFHRRVLSSGN